MTKYLTLSKYSVLVINWAIISKSVVGLLVRRWPHITGILQAAVCLCDPLASLRLHIAKVLAWLCFLSRSMLNNHGNVTGTRGAAVCLYDPLALQIL